MVVEVLITFGEILLICPQRVKKVKKLLNFTIFKDAFLLKTAFFISRGRKLLELLIDFCLEASVFVFEGLELLMLPINLFLKRYVFIIQSSVFLAPLFNFCFKVFVFVFQGIVSLTFLLNLVIFVSLNALRRN